MSYGTGDIDLQRVSQKVYISHHTNRFLRPFHLWHFAPPIASIFRRAFHLAERILQTSGLSEQCIDLVIRVGTPCYSTIDHARDFV